MSENSRERYIPLFKALLKHSNIVSAGMKDVIPLNDSITITISDWIVAELIVEKRDEYCSMVELSRMIGLPPSSFFRAVSHLQKAGLVEKYRIQGNKKSIVLRPTEQAVAMYEKRSTEDRERIWGGFFEALDGFSDEQIATLTKAFDKLNESIPSAKYSQEIELVKVE